MVTSITKLSRCLSPTRVEKDETSRDFWPALTLDSLVLRFHSTSLMEDISSSLWPSYFSVSHLSSVRIPNLNEEISQRLRKTEIPSLEIVPRFPITTPVGLWWERGSLLNAFSASYTNLSACKSSFYWEGVTFNVCSKCYSDAIQKRASSWWRDSNVVQVLSCQSCKGC